MSDAVSASILRFVLHDLKTQQQPGNARLNVSDTHGQALAALPAGDLVLLQSASQLVHRGAVKRVTAQPSQRSFFRVESLNRYQPRNSNGNNGDDANASYVSHLDTSVSQPFDSSLVCGRGPNYYNVLPHYCSCQGFHEHTVVQSPVAMCKHMLAALLADATGQCPSITIQDLDFAKMLCAQIEPSSEHTTSHRWKDMKPMADGFQLFRATSETNFRQGASCQARRFSALSVSLFHAQAFLPLSRAPVQSTQAQQQQIIQPPSLKMIRFFLLQNRQGKTRLSKWYVPPPDDQDKARLEAEIHRLVVGRDAKHTNFIEFRSYKIIYRRYAGLFFILGVDVTANELLCLETIHLFVELLDQQFSNVCELDIVFNFNKVYSMLDEYILGGEVQETSKREMLERIRELEKLE